MNLTRRGPRFTFQKRIPRDLTHRFGASPIRLPLPPCGAREAQRLAALLGGQLEVRFLEARLARDPEDEDPRDALIRDLTEQLEQLRELYRTKVGAAELAVKEAERRQEAAGQRLAVVDDRLHQLYDRVRGLAGSSDPAGLENRLEAMQAQLAALVGAQATPVPPPPVPAESELPLFSEAFQEYLAEQIEEQPDSKFYRYTVPAAGAAFVEILGDRRLGAYTLKDFQRCARVLARVPANRKKLRRFAALTYEEAGDANAGLPKPFPTLTATTIARQYLAPIKAAFAWICAQEEVRDPFATAKVAKAVPRTAKPAQERHPLTVAQQVAFLKKATTRARPDERWLPLLGLATGCRLAELVYLQGRDLVWLEDAEAWALDLRSTVLIDGHERPRPLKTATSRRVIALPDIVDQAGFIDWARERPGFIFDLLHRTKDPASAASKRLIRMLREIGIRGEEGQVFHSLRHTHKDWLRDCGVADRTIDIQSGHALEGVAKRYGAKTLRAADVRLLARCELPAEVARAAARYERITAGDSTALRAGRRRALRATPNR